MYPTVVVVMVETQRSMADICEISPSNISRLAGPQVSEPRAATLGPLSFAVGPIDSAMDNAAQSPLQSDDVHAGTSLGEGCS